MSNRLDRITDQAALWFVRAQDTDFSGADREEFASWLAGSAEHVLEYLSLTVVSREIRAASPSTDVDALLALARESSDRHNVVAILTEGPAIDSQPAESTNRKGRRAVWPVASSVAIAALAGIWFFLNSGPVVYSTGVGEQASFALADGSVVNLNAQSSLELHYTESERTVRLVTGEVLFVVEKDPDRPFLVLTERAVVRAVGTSFNVRQRGETTTVTVVEGIVDVRLLDGLQEGGALPSQSADVAALPGGEAIMVNGLPAKDGLVRLGAGQQARVEQHSPQVAVVDANIEKATSWRQRRLVFDSWQVADVVAEFNLYGDRRIVIEDSDLASRLISGAFDADDPESFALFLSEIGLAVAGQRTDGVILLRLPHEAP